MGTHKISQSPNLPISLNQSKITNPKSKIMHPSHLLNPPIAHLEEYTPIQPFEVLSARLGIPAAQIVKLDANENPYGPIPAVREALAEYAYYHIYPDPQQSELRAALSDFVGVPAAHILPGHGADELLDYLGRLFLAPGDAILNTPPTFGMYSFDAKLQGAEVIDVRRRRDDYSVDVDAIHSTIFNSQISIKLLFLTSPNNPSGNLLSDDDLRRLLALPVMVVLDEAYIEFADHAQPGVLGAGTRQSGRPAHLQQGRGHRRAAPGLWHLPVVAVGEAVDLQAALQRQRGRVRGRAGQPAPCGTDLRRGGKAQKRAGSRPTGKAPMKPTIVMRSEKVRPSRLSCSK